MPRFALLVADAARARLFHVAPTDGDPVRGVTLDERGDYINPERRRPAGEGLADHPGVGHAASGVGYGLDHSEDRTREVDRRFAAELAAALAQVIAGTGTTRAVLIASPRMLGELRPACKAALGAAIEVSDRGLDLTRLTTPQLHDRLAELGLVPARERLARA